MPASAPPFAAPTPPAVDPRNPLQDPWDAHIGDTSGTTAGIGQARSAYDTRIGALNAQEGEGLRRLGVRVGNDPVTGRTFSLDLEGNPYSDAARIARQYNEQRQGQMNTAGASIFDGSFGATQRDTNYREGATNDRLINSARDFYSEIEQERGNAFRDAMEIILGLRTGDSERAAGQVRDTPLPTPDGIPDVVEGVPTKGRSSVALGAGDEDYDAGDRKRARRVRKARKR